MVTKCASLWYPKLTTFLSMGAFEKAFRLPDSRQKVLEKGNKETQTPTAPSPGPKKKIHANPNLRSCVQGRNRLGGHLRHSEHFLGVPQATSWFSGLGYTAYGIRHKFQLSPPHYQTFIPGKMNVRNVAPLTVRSWSKTKRRALKELQTKCD